MARHARETHVTYGYVLQLWFLTVHHLLSMAYEKITRTESAIVDFKGKNIQNLEESKILLGFRRKTGQVHWPVRHPEPRPEVL